MTTIDINELEEDMVSIHSSFRLNEIDFCVTNLFRRKDNLEEVSKDLNVFFVNGARASISTIDYSEEDIISIFDSIRDFFDDDIITIVVTEGSDSVACHLPKDNIRVWTYGKKGRGKKKEEIYTYKPKPTKLTVIKGNKTKE